VKSIKKQHLVEVRSMGNPPTAVKIALESICLLLGENAQDWKAIRSVIVRENFINTIVNFSTDDITYVDWLLCKCWIHYCVFSCNVNAPLQVVTSRSWVQLLLTLESNYISHISDFVNTNNTNFCRSCGMFICDSWHLFIRLIDCTRFWILQKNTRFNL